MNTAILNINVMKIDDIIGKYHLYARDKSEKKVNMSFGAIYNEKGEYNSFESVYEAEKIVVQKYKKKPYIFSNGTKEFSILTQELLFGKNSEYIKEKKICTIQAIGGCGSICLIFLFLKTLGINTINLTNIPYSNYINLAKTHGLTPKFFKFYDTNIMDINYEWFLDSLRNMDDASCILLQVVSHNPCGVNIEEKYFDDIADIVLKKKHIVIFDIAYAGLGNIEFKKDIALIRKFQEKRIHFSICQTFSKCMGLYGDRGGVLHIVCENKAQRQLISDHIFAMLRAYYTSPSIHVNRIVCELLKNENLKSEWLKELSELSKSIMYRRTLFFEKIEFYQKKYNLNYDWNIYKKQKGLFAFIPMIGKLNEKLRTQYHIYVVDSGRINLSGVTKDNIDYIADSICRCLSESS